MGGKSMDNMSEIVLTMEEYMSIRSMQLVIEDSTSWQIGKTEKFQKPKKKL